jgi:hypothetical protein
VRTVSAAIQIEAPPMAVWAILTDLGRYPEWNPLFLEAAGDIVAGQRIRLTSKQPATGRPMTVKPKIIVAEPGVGLRWVSSLPGIIGGEHSFELSAVDGGTRLIQSESFRGPLVPFSGKTLASTEAAFQALNQALKERAEAR